MDKSTWKKSCKNELQNRRSSFAAIGFGEIGAISIFNRLTEKERREEERAKARAEAEELCQRAEKGSVRIKKRWKSQA